MLTTNELGIVSDVIGPVTQSTINSEVVSTILGIVIAVILGLWKRSSVKSKTQAAVAEVIIRALKKTVDRLGDEDTSFVTQTVQQEAKAKGIEQHVEKAVDKVTTKMAQEENGNDSAKL